jgi:hypothetical protein
MLLGSPVIRLRIIYDELINPKVDLLISFGEMREERSHNMPPWRFILSGVRRQF